MKNNRINAVSLFANVGIAESYFEEIGIDVIVANEIDEKRIKFYKHLYPNTDVVQGDITIDNTKEKILNSIGEREVDLLIATPPCQGMSTAGKQDKCDFRNTLICHAVEMVERINPKYIFFENVPEQLNTNIYCEGEKMKIPDYLKYTLGDKYDFNSNFLINSADYGVPQTRERAIILLTRKDVNFRWTFPEKHSKQVTLKDAIGNLPSLDPELYDLSEEEREKIYPNFHEKKEKGLEVSKWHYPPKHVYRQVYSLSHTPSGKSAFENSDEFKPRKKDGTLTKGFKNTYKRQCWDKPGFTVTMYNRTIGSQNNVHPGHYLGKNEQGNDIYSDPRVLTIYELMIISSLPGNWNIPDWASDHFVRQVIGEGIPPLLVKQIMQQLLEAHNA